MRVEPFGIGSYVHVVKRGARGEHIVRDDLDRIRFEKLLFYLNDEFRSDFWEDDLGERPMFERPEHWPERNPLTSIIAWTLMPNHFHLILLETRDGGVSRLLKSVCGSMSRHFNEKYKEKGSLFQGSYRSRTIDSDKHLRWATSYVLVKNVFELYAGGYDRAVKQFEAAWKWGATEYKFSGLKEVTAPGKVTATVTDTDAFREVYGSPTNFKQDSRDMVLSRKWQPPPAVSFE